MVDKSNVLDKRVGHQGLLVSAPTPFPPPPVFDELKVFLGYLKF